MTFSVAIAFSASFISIHTFLAEGDNFIPHFLYMFHVISIHTFLAEGDDEMMYNYDISFISIHTFLAEGDCKFAGGIWTR